MRIRIKLFSFSSIVLTGHVDFDSTDKKGFIPIYLAGIVTNIIELVILFFLEIDYQAYYAFAKFDMFQSFTSYFN